MQDSPQQRGVDLKRQCRQIHEGVCRAQRTLSSVADYAIGQRQARVTAKEKVATATFRLTLPLRFLDSRFRINDYFSHDLHAFLIVEPFPPDCLSKNR